MRGMAEEGRWDSTSLPGFSGGCCFAVDFPLHSSRQKEFAMLVLTRRIGETLFFELPTGDRIEVAVLGNKGSQVRVGIEAPAEVNVVREEVRLREACGE